jgi:predicted DNA-binding ribbon-helix-helix protein
MQKKLSSHVTQVVAPSKKRIQTSIMLEAELWYAIKEIILKRKCSGSKPDNLNAIVTQALHEIVEKENRAR